MHIWSRFRVASGMFLSLLEFFQVFLVIDVE